MWRWLLVVAICGVAACGSEITTAESDELAPPTIAFDGALATAAAARVAHGERLTRVLGCTGCHGKTLQGERFYELYASNLSRDIAKYTDDQFERLLRGGVHRRAAKCGQCLRKLSSTSAIRMWWP